jgi:holo-[acyl-carrier protein] synthase
MAIIGLGLDLVDIARVQRLLDKSDDFKDSCFTELEQTCDGPGHTVARHYASKYAAKEAVVKALGTGFSNGIAWNEIEVAREHKGVSTVALTGTAKQIADKAGVKYIVLHICHTSKYAIANVIMISE